ncbi:MAG TPA: hypothetical protein VGT60_01675, partial [Candidatus Limnocylindria bacterium]|nr:hypothetical protein [Candidatus Limnocylindria bacterium]
RELRARLRRFADARSIGESDALRLIVSEYLNEIVSVRELEAAERWQFKQAYATFQRDNSGKGRTVPWSELQRVIAEARAKRTTRRR